MQKKGIIIENFINIQNKMIIGCGFNSLSLDQDLQHHRRFRFYLLEYSLFFQVLLY